MEPPFFYSDMYMKDCGQIILSISLNSEPEYPEWAAVGRCLGFWIAKRKE